MKLPLKSPFTRAVGTVSLIWLVTACSSHPASTTSGATSPSSSVTQASSRLTDLRTNNLTVDTSLNLGQSQSQSQGQGKIHTGYTRRPTGLTDMKVGADLAAGAPAAILISVSLADLTSEHAGCTAETITGNYSPACFAALHRLCTSIGYAAGVFQEISLPGIYVTCFSGNTAIHPQAELSSIQPGSTSAGTPGFYSEYDTSAAYLACKEQQNLDFGMIVEVAQPSVGITCAPATSYVIDGNQSAAIHPAATGAAMANPNAAWSQPFWAVAGRVCRGLGYVGGGPIGVDATGPGLFFFSCLR